jgi:hypothetical protein
MKNRIFKSFFGISKMDKKKCPKMKTQKNFWKKYVKIKL